MEKYIFDEGNGLWYRACAAEIVDTEIICA